MKKILVAEDEQNIREFVVINLKRAGYDCVEAASGEEALRVYEQAGGDFDVAVLDIMMPGSLDGFAGTVRRAPKWMIRLQLEWLYRLLREPSRIGRMMRLPKFVFAAWRARGKKE